MPTPNPVAGFTLYNFYALDAGGGDFNLYAILAYDTTGHAGGDFFRIQRDGADIGIHGSHQETGLQVGHYESGVTWWGSGGHLRVRRENRDGEFSAWFAIEITQPITAAAPVQAVTAYVDFSNLERWRLQIKFPQQTAWIWKHDIRLVVTRSLIGDAVRGFVVHQEDGFQPIGSIFHDYPQHDANIGRISSQWTQQYTPDDTDLGDLVVPIPIDYVAKIREGDAVSVRVKTYYAFTTSPASTSDITFLIAATSSIPPTLAGNQEYSFVKGEDVSQQIEGSGGTGFTAMGLPPGLTINATGTVSGVPTTVGSYTATVTATNSIGDTTSTVIFTITTVEIDAKPEIVVGLGGDFSIEVYQFEPINIAIGATNEPSKWIAQGLPTGLTITNGGIIAGAPLISGIFTATVQASNQFGTSDPAYVYIKVLQSPAGLLSESTVVDLWIEFLSREVSLTPISYSLAAQNAATTVTATNAGGTTTETKNEPDIQLPDGIFFKRGDSLSFRVQVTKLNRPIALAGLTAIAFRVRPKDKPDGKMIMLATTFTPDDGAYLVKPNVEKSALYSLAADGEFSGEFEFRQGADVIWSTKTFALTIAPDLDGV